MLRRLSETSPKDRQTKDRETKDRETKDRETKDRETKDRETVDIFIFFISTSLSLLKRVEGTCHTSQAP